MSNRRHWRFVCASLTYFSVAISANAQSVSGAAVPAPVSGASSAGGEALEAITVTAQRISQDLEKTPVSVQVLTAADLEQQNIRSEADLQLAVPGLTVRAGNNSDQLNYVIRGQSVDSYSGSQPAVQPYINEIPVTGLLASSFYDLESVQVLKGPQGTLFGRNTTGGAVLFTTAKPTNDFGGFMEVNAGDYKYREVRGAINVPVIDNILAVRIATDLDWRDGFTRNLADNSILGDVDRKSGRLSVLLTPTSSVSDNLTAQYDSIGGSPQPGVLYYVSPVGATNHGIPVNTDAATFYPGIVNYLGVQQARGPYVVDLNGNPTISGTNWTVANTTAWDLTSNLKLRNIFGYVSQSNTQNGADIDGSSYPIETILSPNGQVEDDIQETEEVQLIGSALQDDLTYIGGLYFEHSHNYYDLNVNFFDIPPISPGTTENLGTLIRDTGSAAYVQGTYSLARMTGVQGLSVTAGYRYTHSDISSDVNPNAASYNAPGTVNHIEQTTNQPGYQFRVEEQLNQNLLLYVVTRRSFRNGAYNVFAPQRPQPDNAAAGGNGYLPEILKDVELGTKFQQSVGGVPIRVNVALYRSWVSDIQRAAYVPVPGYGVLTLVANVPNARIQGVEVEGVISPSSWLDLGVNGAYTDAVFTNGNVNLFGTPLNFGPYADTPAWSGSAYAKLSIPLPRPEVGQLSIRGDLYGQTKDYFGSLNNSFSPGSEIPGYGILNFRVALDHIGGSGVSVAAYVKNALDHYYWVGGIATSGGYGSNEAVAGEPRTFYFQVHDNF